MSTKILSYYKNFFIGFLLRKSKNRIIFHLTSDKNDTLVKYITYIKENQ